MRFHQSFRGAESIAYPGHELLHLSEGNFAQLVNASLKDYRNVLALARSPLADSPLVTPLLVLDDVSPTAEERGQALRLVLQWAVGCLAPEQVTFPLGSERPFDDPSWRDPRWWRYNILRHRYFEPLRPDDFIAGGRVTETLVALTGIPSSDTFFDERNRAVNELAQWLRQQLLHGQASDELQRLALAEVHRLLRQHPAAGSLLGIAATFDEVFPRWLLLQLAETEKILNAAEALEFLTMHRILQVGDAGASLWLSTVLRRDSYARVPRATLQIRHRRVAHYYMGEENLLQATSHSQKAGDWRKAATLMLPIAGDLIQDLQTGAVLALLQTFEAKGVDVDQWRDIQILLSDLLAMNGQHDEALAACRRALKVTAEPKRQASIYRRMGKLFEDHNQLHALNYYQQAIERFDLADGELIDLLKDRAWLYILRQEWDLAERDLTLALARTPDNARQQRANLYDAFSYLSARREQYTSAIQYAQQALALREESGDMLRVANSFVNLGLLYTDMKGYAHAISAQQDALAIYRRLDNRPKTATVLLNIGLVHHLAGRLQQALQPYEECLAICREIGLPLIESKAHSNLSEAYGALGQTAQAKQHWQWGYQIAVEAGFDDQIAYFEGMLANVPGLQELDATWRAEPTGVLRAGVPVLAAEEQQVLALARDEGRLTAQRLVEALYVSRATATRRLASLVEQGYLLAHGKGRGVYYALSHTADPATHQRAVEPSVAQERSQVIESVRNALQQHRHELMQQYSVDALGVSEQSELRPSPVRLIVRLEPTSHLENYFDLKRYLSAVLQSNVDLVPEFAAPSSQTPGAVEWVWHA